MNSYLHEIEILLRALIKWVATLLGLSMVLFSVRWGTSTLFGHTFPSPVFSSQGIAGILFERMTHDLLPAGTNLVVSNPLDGFLIEMEMSFVLAGLLLLPFFLVWLFGYFSPALTGRERRALAFMTIPALLLFFAGALFSYLFVVPQLYSFMVLYVPAIDAQPLFSADTFFDGTVGLLVACGFMFELPVLMYLLSFIGLIKPVFWFVHWRAAVLTILIVTAIITPDGSGISMAILSAPLILLYFLGAALSLWRSKRKRVALTT